MKRRDSLFPIPTKARTSSTKKSLHIRWATLAFTVLLLFLFSAPAWADPFLSAPGARAKAMGGAFCAISDDFSAVWHNPAGLAGIKPKMKKKRRKSRDLQLVTEWSQVAITENDPASLSRHNAWFFGGTYQTPEYATGAYYYTPYVIQYRAQDPKIRDGAWGQVEETIQVFSVPIALNLPMFKDMLKLGGTLDWVRADIGGSRIAYRDDTGFVYGYSTDSGTESALSGSFSFLFTPVDSDAFKLNIGGTYRLEGNTDMGKSAMQADTDTGVSRLFFDRPSSFDIGIGLSKLVKINNRKGYEFNLGLQYGRTDWGGAAGSGGSLEYDRLSAGLEFALLKPRQRFNRFAFRAGYFTSDPSGDTPNNQDWPDVTGVTWGAGVRMGQLSLDISQELVTHDGTADEDILLTSVGVSLLF